MLINIPFRRNASIFVKYLTKYNNAFISKKTPDAAYTRQGYINRNV